MYFGYGPARPKWWPDAQFERNRLSRKTACKTHILIALNPLRAIAFWASARNNIRRTVSEGVTGTDYRGLFKLR